MDNNKVREVLTALLTEVADQAKKDALAGTSDIGSIYKKTHGGDLQSLDEKKVQEAINDINKAAATKEGARRLINAIMVAAKVIAKVALPPS